MSLRFKQIEESYLKIDRIGFSYDNYGYDKKCLCGSDELTRNYLMVNQILRETLKYDLKIIVVTSYLNVPDYFFKIVNYKKEFSKSFEVTHKMHHFALRIATKNDGWIIFKKYESQWAVGNNVHVYPITRESQLWVALDILYFYEFNRMPIKTLETLKDDVQRKNPNTQIWMTMNLNPVEYLKNCNNETFLESLYFQKLDEGRLVNGTEI